MIYVGLASKKNFLHINCRIHNRKERLIKAMQYFQPTNINTHCSIISVLIRTKCKQLDNDLLSITSICRIYAKYVSFLRSMVLLGLYNDLLSDSIIKDYSSMESSTSIVQSLHEQEVWLSRVLGIISVTEWKSDETILYLIRLCGLLILVSIYRLHCLLYPISLDRLN